MRRSRVIVLAAVLIVGCDKKCPEDPAECLLQAKGDDAGALSSCIVGAWRAYGDGGSCSPIPCRPDAGPPECAQPDCVQQSVLVFVPDSDASSSGTMFSTGFIASSGRGTWSNVFRPEQRSFSVDGGQLSTGTGSAARAQFVTCTAQQLVLGEFALKTRSSAAETAALRALMLDGGPWSGLPLP